MRVGQDTPANIPDHRTVERANVGSDYARTMGITVIEGRDVAETDRAGSLPVALVNQTLARRFWPGGSPLGRRIDSVFAAFNRPGSPGCATASATRDCRSWWGRLT